MVNNTAPEIVLVLLSSLIKLSYVTTAGQMRQVSRKAISDIVSDFQTKGFSREKFGRPTINIQQWHSLWRSTQTYRSFEHGANKTVLNEVQGVLDEDKLRILNIEDDTLPKPSLTDGRHRIRALELFLTRTPNNTVFVVCNVSTFKDFLDMRVDSFNKSEIKPSVPSCLSDLFRCLPPKETFIRMKDLYEYIKNRPQFGFSPDYMMKRVGMIYINIFASCIAILDKCRDAEVFNRALLRKPCGHQLEKFFKETGFRVIPRVPYEHGSRFRIGSQSAVVTLKCKEVLQSFGIGMIIFAARQKASGTEAVSLSVASIFRSLSTFPSVLLSTMPRLLALASCLFAEGHSKTCNSTVSPALVFGNVLVTIGSVCSHYTRELEQECLSEISKLCQPVLPNKPFRHNKPDHGDNIVGRCAEATAETGNMQGNRVEGNPVSFRTVDHRKDRVFDRSDGLAESATVDVDLDAKTIKATINIDCSMTKQFSDQTAACLQSPSVRADETVDGDSIQNAVNANSGSGQMKMSEKAQVSLTLQTPAADAEEASVDCHKAAIEKKTMITDSGLGQPKPDDTTESCVIPSVRDPVTFPENAPVDGDKGGVLDDTAESRVILSVRNPVTSPENAPVDGDNIGVQKVQKVSKAVNSCSRNNLPTPNETAESSSGSSVQIVVGEVQRSTAGKRDTADQRTKDLRGSFPPTSSEGTKRSGEFSTSVMHQVDVVESQGFMDVNTLEESEKVCEMRQVTELPNLIDGEGFFRRSARLKRKNADTAPVEEAGDSELLRSESLKKRPRFAKRIQEPRVGKSSRKVKKATRPSKRMNKAGGKLLSNTVCALNCLMSAESLLDSVSFLFLQQRNESENLSFERLDNASDSIRRTVLVFPSNMLRKASEIVFLVERVQFEVTAVVSVGQDSSIIGDVTNFMPSTIVNGNLGECARVFVKKERSPPSLTHITFEDRDSNRQALKALYRFVFSIMNPVLGILYDSVFDCLSGKCGTILEVLLERSDRFVKYHKVYMQTMPQKEEAMTNILVILRQRVLAACKCSGHEILNTKQGHLLNEDKERKSLTEGRSSFVSKVRNDDLTPTVKLISHPSLLIRSDVQGNLLRETEIFCDEFHNRKNGLLVHRGCFLPKPELEKALKLSGTVELLYPGTYIYDHITASQEYECSLAPFELKSLFVAGLTYCQLSLYFKDISMGSLINEEKNLGCVILHSNFEDPDYLDNLMRNGWQALKTANKPPITCLLDCDKLRQAAIPQMTCRECGALEIFTDYGTEYVHM